MKFKIALVLFFFAALQCYSQTKNNISFSYGSTANTVDIHGAIGDFGYTAESGQLFGLIYTRYIGKRLSLQTGLQYSGNNVQFSYIIPGRGTQYQNGNVKLITLPVYAKRTFFKYLFIDGGLLFDHETNYSPDPAVNDQSGLGLEIGFGGQYSFKNISLFVNPFFRVHSLFNDAKGNDFNLLENGVKFGLGYNF